jgi:hypothetical protein
MKGRSSPAPEIEAAPSTPPPTAKEPVTTDLAAPAEDLAATEPLGREEVPVMPTVSEGVTTVYLDPAATWAGKVGADPTGTRLTAAIAATVNLTYDDTKAGVNHQEAFEAVVFPVSPVLGPDSIREVDHDPRDFRSDPPEGAAYVLPEQKIDTKSFWTGVDTDLTNHLVGARKMTVFKNDALKLYSRPGESRDAFAARAMAVGESAVDDAIAKLREKHAVRLERAQAALAKAENRVADLEATAGSKQTEELLSGAGDIIGVLFGGRSRSNPLGQAARRRSAASQARARAENAKATLSEEQAELEALRADLEDEVADLEEEVAAKVESIEEVEIPLEKTDVRVAELKLVWVPTG